MSTLTSFDPRTPRQRYKRCNRASKAGTKQRVIEERNSGAALNPIHALRRPSRRNSEHRAIVGGAAVRGRSVQRAVNIEQAGLGKVAVRGAGEGVQHLLLDRKSTRLNSSHI